jgi:hypothetical protein
VAFTKGNESKVLEQAVNTSHKCNAGCPIQLLRSEYKKLGSTLEEIERMELLGITQRVLGRQASASEFYKEKH